MLRRTPEKQVRKDVIDRLLESGGWQVVRNGQILPSGCFACEEYSTTTGPVDYALIVNGDVIGLVEAKKPTTAVWIYDWRTNVNKITKKDKLAEEHFGEFISLYKGRKETERFKRFTLDEIKKREHNLDIFWLNDNSLDSGVYEEPEVIVRSIKESEERILEELEKITSVLHHGNAK